MEIKKNREEVLILLGELYAFTFNEKADKKFKEILSMLKSKDREIKNLAVNLLHSIFHDEKLVGALGSSYKYGSYADKGVTDEIILVGEKFPIGYKCANHLTSSYSDYYPQNINFIDDTKYGKYVRRIKRIINSLKKYDNKNK